MNLQFVSATAVVALCLVPAASVRSRCAEPSTEDAEWAARGDEVVRTVREHFFDPKTAAAWAEKHAGYAEAAGSEGRFVELTRQALAELKASHTGYFTADDPEYHGLLAIFAVPLDAGTVEWDSPGADFTPDHFVRTVFAAGPADEAGLRRGDKILQADGEDFHPVTSFRGKAGRPVTLTVQRRAEDDPFEIRLTPRRTNPKQEWLEAMRNGATLLEHDGKMVGYVPMFSCAGEEYQEALRELLSGRLSDADALIVDFRDGFGGCNPNFVNLFNPTPAALTYIGRDGDRREFDAQWRKPLVVLINGGTRSGKEVVSHSVRKHRLGTLVGRRTAAAVVGGRCFRLSDDSLMYLAVNDILVDGKRLEGRGVDPDVEVADDLPFAAGADPQLDRAIEIATR